MSDYVLLWSKTKNAYLRPDKKTYTINVLFAGVFTREEAHEITGNHIQQPVREFVARILRLPDLGGTLAEQMGMTNRIVEDFDCEPTINREIL